MPHRDDLEAAHARIGALERELAEARKQRETGDAEAARTPPATPEGLEIEDRPGCLRIAWHWTISVAELVAMITIGALIAVMVAVAAVHGDGRAIFAVLALGLFGLWLVYRVAGQAVNRTIIEVTDGELRISIGPLSLQAPPSLSRGEIEQLFCVPIAGRHRTWYELHALLAGGQRVRLIAEITDAERALFVEHAIERRLGIPDRPVEGEVVRRP